MLAFDLPPHETITVEYVGLAPSYHSSEMQKDLLRRALSEILPRSGEIIEASEAKKLSEERAGPGIYVRCIKCDLRSDFNGDLSQSTIRIQSSEFIRSERISNSSQFKIDITPTGKPTQTWTIDIGLRKIAFFPVLKGDSIRASGRLSSENFLIETCIRDVSCPKTKLSVSAADVKMKISQWKGRKIDVASANLPSQESAHILSEKIPFVSDVRAQSYVRATMTSKSTTLVIKTAAKALKNGIIGDIIPIELETSSGSFKQRKLLNATIIGEGEVEIVR